MLAYRNPLGVLGTLSSDCSLYKTVNHKHNFRSHAAVYVFIIWQTTPNCRDFPTFSKWGPGTNDFGKNNA